MASRRPPSVFGKNLSPTVTIRASIKGIAIMASINWNKTPGNWTNPDHWTPAAAPVAGDSATIANAGKAAIEISESESAAADNLLKNDTDATLKIDGVLTIANEIQLQAETIRDSISFHGAHNRACGAPTMSKLLSRVGNIGDTGCLEE
jgi:hypothetical protein